MKAIKIIFILSIFSLQSNLFSQVILLPEMMPLAGDTIFYRSLSNPSIDTSLTGEDFTWDFSQISANNWAADTFVAVNSTPIAYNAQFNNNMFPKYKATVASPQGDVNVPIGGFNFTNIFFYYKLSGDSVYSQVGQAITVNNIPIPIKFTDIDDMYQFPSIYGDYDTCYSSYSVTIPQVGFNSRQQTRYNLVDGYGTVITPIDTFYNAIRIKTIIKSRDSIYSDQYNMPFAFNITTTEYKWFTEGHRGPVVIISKSQGAGNNRNTIKFIDTPEPIPYNVNTFEQPSIQIYPNPFNEYLYINVDSENLPCIISINDINGKNIKKTTCYSEDDLISVSNILCGFKSGLYFLTVKSQKNVEVQKIIKR